MRATTATYLSGCAFGFAAEAVDLALLTRELLHQAAVLRARRSQRSGLLAGRRRLLRLQLPRRRELRLQTNRESIRDRVETQARTRSQVKRYIHTSSRKSWTMPCERDPCAHVHGLN